MGIKGKPDISSFIDGGSGSEKGTSNPAVTKKIQKPKESEKTQLDVPKKAKLVELPEPMFIAIKDRAYSEYKRTGKRVTDTDIIIEALAKYLNI